MNNLDLYNNVRAVPKDATKSIGGGRLKGMTDINPMWRIKMLTEQFGPCGIGWYYEITNQWLEQGANGEIAGFCNINLYIKDKDQWSKPIQGTGGSAFIAKEKNGPYTSDEVYKMALTDAISVACKALGFGADIYWASDRTKYDAQTERAKAAAEAKVETKTEPQPKVEPVEQKAPAETTLTEEDISAMILDIMSCNNIAEITDRWNNYKAYDKATDMRITGAVRMRRKELGV